MIWTWREGFLWFATNGFHLASGWNEDSAVMRLNEKLKGIDK